VTRMGSGEERAMLVWRLKSSGGVEEEPVDEIELTSEDMNLASESKDFSMKGGVVVNNENNLGQDTEQILMMYAFDD
jgi:hypothetical protein